MVQPVVAATAAVAATGTTSAIAPIAAPVVNRPILLVLEGARYCGELFSEF